jgi:hypothetical protein
MKPSPLVTAHGALKADIAALERLARTCIKRLSDWQRRLSYDHAAQSTDAFDNMSRR